MYAVFLFIIITHTNAHIEKPLQALILWRPHTHTGLHRAFLQLARNITTNAPDISDSRANVMGSNDSHTVLLDSSWLNSFSVGIINSKEGSSRLPSITERNLVRIFLAKLNTADVVKTGFSGLPVMRKRLNLASLIYFKIGEIAEVEHLVAAFDPQMAILAPVCLEENEQTSSRVPCQEIKRKKRTLKEINQVIFQLFSCVVLLCFYSF